MAGYPADEMILRVAADGHAPLHFLLLDLWIDIWGDSLAAMRSLSVLFGVAAVTTIYLCVREALEMHACSDNERRVFAREERVGARRIAGLTLANGCALCCALLAFLSVLQIRGATTARMYSLGAFFAALSGWLLLRALRAGCRRPWWWAGYGVCVAAFCYTHYFAFFTVLAQTIFVAGYLLHAYRICRGNARRKRQSQESTTVSTAGAPPSGIQSSREMSAIRQSAFGFACAGALALTLYSPWLPVFRSQAAAVYEHFWIPPITWHQAALVFGRWATGTELHHTVICVSALLILTATAFALRRGGAAACFFFLQAAVPWAFCLSISFLSGRSVLQERYLTFAQLAYFGLLAVVLANLPGRMERLGLATVLLGAAALGLAARTDLFPNKPHAGELAMSQLRRQYRPGDLILVSRPAEVNRTRYYASRLGIEPIDVRCYQSVFPRKGHTVHVASLDARDIIWSDKTAIAATRVWTLVYNNKRGTILAPADMTRAAQFNFSGSDNSASRLTLFKRAD